MTLNASARSLYTPEDPRQIYVGKLLAYRRALTAQQQALLDRSMQNRTQRVRQARMQALNYFANTGLVLLLMGAVGTASCFAAADVRPWTKVLSPLLGMCVYVIAVLTICTVLSKERSE